MKVDGSRLLLLSDKGVLEVVDVSDPASARVVGQVSFEGAKVDGIEAGHGRAYLTSRFNASVTVVDIADPSRPTKLGEGETGYGPPQQAVLDGAYLYIAAADGGLRVMSVADPARLAEVGAFNPPGHPTGSNSIAVSGGYAYIADSSNGLHVVRVDDPAHPNPVAAFRDGAEARRVKVSGSLLYLLEYGIGSASSGLRILDVRDPTHPTLVGSVDYPGYVDDLALAGSFAYTVTNSQLHVLDVSDPSRPREVGTFAPTLDPSIQESALAGRSGRVAVSGQYAYLASETCVQTGRNSTPEPAHAASGLRVIDLSNPAAPTEVAFTRLAWSPDAVAVVGSAIYVVANHVESEPASGLRVFDVSNPTSPAETASLPVGGGFYGGSVSLSGKYAFVAAYGLHVLDTTDPAHPVEVGAHPALVHSLVADGSVAYAGLGSDGLAVFRFTGAGP